MLVGQLHAQMLSPSVYNEPKNHLLFHTEFQKQNGIKSIHGVYSHKRVNERITELPGKLTIEFDQLGRLTCVHDVKQLAGKLDTNYSQWNYVNNQTSSTFEADAMSYICTVFEEKGDTIFETAYRTPSLPNSTEELTSKNLYWSYEEMCVIEKRSPQRIELYHNTIGLPYKRRSISYDDLGYVTSIEDRLLVTDRLKKSCFTYNEGGQLTSRKKYKGTELIESTIYDYAASGNLMSWYLYKSDQLVKHHEVLYDSRGLVEAIILKHMATERLEIIQYSYKFYPK